MSSHRVVVTGVGVISALGQNRFDFWDALLHGRSGIAPIESLDCSGLRFRNGAEVRGFVPQEHFERRDVDLMDRFAQFSVVAAREAVADAQVEWTSELREGAAIATGSTVGGRAAEEQVHLDLYCNGRKHVHPLSIPRAMANAGASHISMQLGIQGPAFTTSTACSSSNHAIGHAFWMVRHGIAPMAIAGGSDAAFHIGFLKGWDSLRAVSPDTCRPFCKDRRGMIIAEAGAMLVLEPLEAALARGAPIRAEIIGFGMSADAHHLTAPAADGAARAMKAALRDAGIPGEQVGYINAHGTGTAANDVMETSAIRSVFGTHADQLAVSSTKSMHGHAMGASSALEAIATVLALQHGVLPPTANFTEPDPECDLDVIPNQARPAAVQCALSNSFAFGGLNATLAFRCWDA